MRCLIPRRLRCIALAGPAFAQDVPGCDNATRAMSRSARAPHAAYEKADKELNAIWPKVLAYIDTQDDTMPADALQTWKATIVAAAEGVGELQGERLRRG